MQIGGMALRDGVLLQSDRYWAAAVRARDGSVKVTSGAKTAITFDSATGAGQFIEAILLDNA